LQIAVAIGAQLANELEAALSLDAPGHVVSKEAWVSHARSIDAGTRYCNAQDGELGSSLRAYKHGPAAAMLLSEILTYIVDRLSRHRAVEQRDRSSATF
jgi:hypothetical protein